MLTRIQHWLMAVVVSLFVGIFLPQSVMAAPYAALVMDARTGQVLHARNADTRLHPASLTKMMTLYVAFQAVERGEISLDTKVRVSRNAANEEPSRLGLKAGQRISLRYLIRGSAVKSGNDAATAIGEAISGSEAAFARRMTVTARRMGMKNTTFKNANGLTQAGHMSTARDMSILGRRLFYDYPGYYHLFSRRTIDAGVRKVSNTNTRLLSNYRGADGIKTGYTRAAGFNLVASAHRGNKRVIATVFGGQTTASRNARVAELLDMGFKRVNPRLAERKPKRIAPVTSSKQKTSPVKAKTIKLLVSGAVKRSPIPRLRPQAPAVAPVLVAKVDPNELDAAMLKAVAETNKPTAAPKPAVKPVMRTANVIPVAVRLPEPVGSPSIVSRKSTSGRAWSVQLGAFGSQYEAEKVLLKTALTNLGPLENSVRRIEPAVLNGRRLYRARFAGLSQADANKTCSRLRARSQTCVTVSPGS